MPPRPGDDSGVTSVIGVILLVAVTVIIASVVAVFALDVAESTSQSPPQVEFEVEQVNATVTDGNGDEATYKTLEISHKGGDTIEESQLSITVDGKTAYGYEDTTNKLLLEPYWQGTGTVDAGSEINIISRTNSMDGEDFSTDYEYDIYTSGDGLVPQDDNNNEFETNTQLRSGETVKIVWKSSDGQEGVVLFEQTIR